MTIVYTSETGITREYAEKIGKQASCSVYSMAEAIQSLPQGTEVLYMSWVMATQVKDMDKVVKHCKMKGLCAVGIRPDVENMVASLEKSSKLPKGSVFYLPGGYRPHALKGGKKVALRGVLSVIRGKLKSQSQRTPEEEQLLEICTHGGSFAEGVDVSPVVQWLETQK